MSYQIYTSDEFSDRMLYLQACVHLKKVEMLISIEQKFKRTSIHVPGSPGDTYCSCTHFIP